MHKSFRRRGTLRNGNFLIKSKHQQRNYATHFNYSSESFAPIQIVLIGTISRPELQLKQFLVLHTARRQDESFLFAGSYRHALIHNVFSTNFKLRNCYRRSLYEWHCNLRDSPTLEPCRSLGFFIAISSFHISPLMGWQDKRGFSSIAKFTRTRSWSLKYFSDSFRVLSGSVFDGNRVKSKHLFHFGSRFNYVKFLHDNSRNLMESLNLWLVSETSWRKNRQEFSD